ncbi:MAG: SIR2 family NAD-dependent protein deacylase, partial [Bellilinea sp.]
MKNIPLPDLIQRATDLVLGSKYTVVFTGAGISTPSGIPDFRSANDGLWTKSDPMEVASYSAFRYHPEKFFNWLKPLAEHIWDASPNSAHESLAQLEQAGYIQALITQNIDGLHQKAGSKQVVEVHGSMNHLRCMVCRLSYPADAYFQQFISAGELPRCSNCHSLL